MKKLTFYVNLVLDSFWLEFIFGLKFRLEIDNAKMYTSSKFELCHLLCSVKRHLLKMEFGTNTSVFRIRLLWKYVLSEKAALWTGKDSLWPASL